MSGLGNRDRKQVLTAADNLEQRLDALPDFDWKNPEPYRDAVAGMVENLTVHNVGPRVTIRENSSGVSISLLGLRASSTGGHVAACRNWIAQARRKAGAS